MLTESKFRLDDPPVQIYNQQKNDYIRVALNPGTSSRVNTGGDLVFEVDNQQSYLYMPDSFLHCEFSLYSNSTLKTALPTTTNITLENNFFPSLFNQIRLEVGSQSVESIASSPGVIDSMLRFAMRATNENEGDENEGWIPDKGSGSYVSVLSQTGTTVAAAAPTKAETESIIADVKTLVDRLNLHEKNKGYTERKEFYNKNGAKQTVEWKLSPLFGYMDYEKISYQLRFRLILNREINNQFIFFGKTGEKAYLKIDNLELWIPHITPSLEIENMITKRLNTNKNIPVSFMGRVAASVNFDQTKYTWHFTRTSNTPRYLFLAFKENKAPDFDNNDSLFHLENIQSVQVLLNQARYPIDPIRIDLTRNYFSEGYNAYKNVCKDFGGFGSHSALGYLSPDEWRNLYPVFCFDLSAQSEDLKKNGCDVTIQIEKKGADSLTAYAVVLEDTYHEIEVLNGRMVRVY